MIPHAPSKGKIPASSLKQMLNQPTPPPQNEAFLYGSSFFKKKSPSIDQIIFLPESA